MFNGSYNLTQFLTYSIACASRRELPPEMIYVNAKRRARIVMESCDYKSFIVLWPIIMIFIGLLLTLDFCWANDGAQCIPKFAQGVNNLLIRQWRTTKKIISAEIASWKVGTRRQDEGARSSLRQEARGEKASTMRSRRSCAWIAIRLL